MTTPGFEKNPHKNSEHQQERNLQIAAVLLPRLMKNPYASDCPVFGDITIGYRYHHNILITKTNTGQPNGLPMWH